MRTMRSGCVRKGHPFVVAIVVGSIVLLIGCGGSNEALDTGAGDTTAPSVTASVFGQGMPADLGVYLIEETTDQELTSVTDELFFVERPDGRGLDPIDGVTRVQVDYGVKAIYIDFGADQSQERIDEVIETVRLVPSVIDARTDAIVGE